MCALHLCTQVHMCVSTHACGGQRTTVGTVPQALFTCLLRQGLSLSWCSLRRLGWLVSEPPCWIVYLHGVSGLNGYSRSNFSLKNPRLFPRDCRISIPPAVGECSHSLQPASLCWFGCDLERFYTGGQLHSSSASLFLPESPSAFHPLAGFYLFFFNSTVNSGRKKKIRFYLRAWEHVQVWVAIVKTK